MMSYSYSKSSDKKGHKHHHRHNSDSDDSQRCPSPPKYKCEIIPKQDTKDIENLKLKVAQLESIIDGLVKHNKEIDVEISSLRYYFANEWKEHVKENSKTGPRGRFNEI